MSPELLMDRKGRVWKFNGVTLKYTCISADAVAQPLSLLNSNHGPLSEVTRGKAVEAPEIYTEGEWVTFSFEDVGDPVFGRVKSYDDGKLYYELIVNVGQDKVKRAE